jgi:ribonuclease R
MEQHIIDYLSRPGYKPLKVTVLARRMNIAGKQKSAFLETMDQLVDSGRVKQSRNGTLRLRGVTNLVAGIVKRTSRGSGFAMLHETPPGLKPGDIYIAANDMGDAHSGDEVLVRVSSRRRAGGQHCGRVEDVVARARNSFVGTYAERDEQGFVRVDGGAFAKDVFVGDPGAKGAKPDDKVVIEMLRFPTHYRAGEAVLTKVLGPRGKTGVDTQAIIHEFGLPEEFSDKVLKAAQQQVESFDETDLADRLDLTGETIVTIDPSDARDFDDAISLSQARNGHWNLGVHIADVSHFVQLGTPLDKEAYTRGTSVYLPRHVIPMLPETLSNGLCSLQQGQVRFVKSALIEFTAEGVPIGVRFANAAIKVTRRFAYEEVMPIVREPEQFKSKLPAKLRKLLSQMYELAMILRQRRFDKGALELSLGETQLDFDDDGHVTGAHEAEHDESHQIIEEFMLAANIAVASEFSNRNVGFLRRVHPDPDELKLRAFGEFVTSLGYPLKRYQSRKDLQALLKRVVGEPAEHAVNYALLRSFKQAVYSGVDMGHYALSAEDYCHFTSPIRRYPDLTVHRLIDRLVKSKRAIRGASDTELAKLGKHCSETERRAEAAERELTKTRLLKFLEEQIGEEMDAIITGVESFGIFCRGMKLPVEGMVHIASLSRDDYFDYDRATHSLTARRRGTQFRLGDRVRVKVVHVDVDDRKLDFRIVEEEGKKRPRTSGPKKSVSKNPSRKRPPRRDTKPSKGKGPSTGKKPKKKKARKSRRRKR